MTGASATQHIDVGIGNKSDLRFVVTDAGNNSFYDHADWAGAAITCATQATPSVTLDKSSLDVYHLHTGTLHATFHNYPKGPAQLALAFDPSADPYPYSGHTPFPLVLQTVQVDLSGAASETKDIVIAAPEPGGNPGINSPKFLLTINASGTATQTFPVTLNELPINFKARFEPENLIGRQGDTVNTVLVVTADPPLDSAQPLGMQLPPGFDFNYPGFFILKSAGPTTGTGSEMRLPVTVTFDFNPEQPSAHVVSTYIGIGVGNITTGYRSPFYGPNPLARLMLTFNP